MKRNVKRACWKRTSLFLPLLLVGSASFAQHGKESDADLSQAISAYLKGDLEHALRLIERRLKTDPGDEKALKLRDEISNEMAESSENAAVSETEILRLKAEKDRLIAELEALKGGSSPGEETPKMNASPAPVPASWITQTTSRLSQPQDGSGEGSAPAELSDPATTTRPESRENPIVTPQPRTDDEQPARLVRLVIETDQDAARLLAIRLSAHRPHSIALDEDQMGVALTVMNATAEPQFREITDQWVQSVRVGPSGPHLEIAFRFRAPANVEAAGQGDSILLWLRPTEGPGPKGM